MANVGTKRHDDRKSEGSAEVWRKQKKQRNAARGKQRYDLERKVWYHDTIAD